MNRWIGLRIGAVYFALAGFMCLIIFRLAQLQILNNQPLQEMATRQFQKVSKTSPYRLPIYDRNEEEMAISIPSSSIFARPKIIRRKKYTAKVLSKLLGGSPSKWYSKLKTDRPFVWIERQANEEKARELAKFQLPGVFVEAENKRIYPNGTLASHILGFTDIDGNGLAGAELSFNDELLQRSTQFRIPRDGRGNPSYIDPSKSVAGPTRAGIYLTIDRRIQHIVEDELDLAMQTTNSKAALAIVMDPKTGEIIAMGQRPSFDPNRPSEADSNNLANRIVSHLYEPGSILKTFFVGEALQLGLLDESTSIDCENGELRVGDRVIHEAESDHTFGRLTVSEVLAYSSNIGAVKIAQYLGIERIREILDKFGFTEKTGIRLPAEATSPPKEDSFWRPVALANVAFGQGVSVTPLQMTLAYATVANGGYRIYPKLVLGEQPSKNKVFAEGQRVFSPNTIATLRSMLSAVTEKKGATGLLAAIPALRVAGKTGTAQKYIVGAGYGAGKYFSSFVGFVPAENAEILVSVMLDEPKWPYYASQIAAPLHRRISERTMQVLGKMPKVMIARERSRTDRVFPPPFLPTERIHGRMPDFAGKTMRDVLTLTESYFKNIKVVGSGYLTSQIPVAGSEVDSSAPVTLIFSPEG